MPNLLCAYSPLSFTPNTDRQDDFIPQAWVIFCNDADLAWLNLLKPRFRHCFVIIKDRFHWLALDGLSPYLELSILPVAHDFDLPKWFLQKGHIVTKASVNRSHKRPAPFAPMSCVEIVKRYLGIHKRLIFTPWQLYKHLQNTTTKG